MVYVQIAIVLIWLIRPVLAYHHHYHELGEPVGLHIPDGLHRPEEERKYEKEVEIEEEESFRPYRNIPNPVDSVNANRNQNPNQNPSQIPNQNPIQNQNQNRNQNPNPRQKRHLYGIGEQERDYEKEISIEEEERVRPYRHLSSNPTSPRQRQKLPIQRQKRQYYPNPVYPGQERDYEKEISIEEEERVRPYRHLSSNPTSQRQRQKRQYYPNPVYPGQERDYEKEVSIEEKERDRPYRNQYPNPVYPNPMYPNQVYPNAILPIQQRKKRQLDPDPVLPMPYPRSARSSHYHHQDQLMPMPRCPHYEVFHECSQMCEPTCTEPFPVCTTGCGPPKCECRRNFVRDLAGRCIPRNACNRPYKEIDIIEVIGDNDGSSINDDYRRRRVGGYDGDIGDVIIDRSKRDWHNATQYHGTKERPGSPKNPILDLAKRNVTGHASIRTPETREPVIHRERGSPSNNAKNPLNS